MVDTRMNGSLTATPNGTGTTQNGVDQSLRKRASDGGLNSEAKRPRIADKTDPTRWRLLDESGRLTWHYLEGDEAVKKWPQSTADKWYLGLDTVSTDGY
jgi:lanosterol synthase